MKSLFAATLGLFALAAPAAAHEVWIERDAAGPARVYLGEPAEAVPAAGDPEFPKLKAPTVFAGDKAKPAALVRRTNHIEAAVPGAGDVRLVDDTVFEPWAGEGGKLEGVVYYARAGRSETAHALDLEFVPVTANGNSFTLLWQGKPLPAAKVTIFNPDRWSKTFVTDAQGRIDVPVGDGGRYLVSVSHEVPGDRALGGKTVAKTYHISTLTYVAS